jgi:Fe-S oxidoreductase
MPFPSWVEISILLILLGASAFLFWRRINPIARTILQSKPEPGFKVAPYWPRIRKFGWEVLLQAKVIRERPLPGVAHALVFWGFLCFGLITLDHLLRGFDLKLLEREAGFGFFYSATAAVFAALVVVSMIGLAIRRFVLRPRWLGRVSRESALITALILILMLSYLAEFAGLLPYGTLGGRISWWAHTMALLVFLPLLPQTKHLHLLLSPITIFLARDGFSRIPPLEGDEDFGIQTGKDVTNIVALQAFSCVECGRCTEHCPANNTGKLLNPKSIIVGVRQYLRDHGPDSSEPIVGKYVPDEMLWQCTSCGACEYQCPVGIEHLPIIIGLRRGRVNTGSWEDAHGNKVFRNLEKNGNALGLPAGDRDKFVRKHDLPVFDGSQEYCLWLGCMGAFDPGGRDTILALVKVLQYLHCTFGVLRKEKCSGDPVRRLGNDYLFTELAQSNIDALKAARAIKLISICPHCVRTIAEDWRELGATVEIEHHSQFLARHAAQLPQKSSVGDKIVFHDPCYLGRYRSVYDEPRTVIDLAGSLVEPVRAQERGFCCGAGGGRAFLGEEPGKRVSTERAEELVGTGAAIIGAACPFCSTMLRDALAQVAPEGPKLFDIVQITAASLPQPTK